VEDHVFISRSEAVNEAIHHWLGGTDSRLRAETAQLGDMLPSLLEIGHIGRSIRPALSAEVEGLRLAERFAILPLMLRTTGEAVLVFLAVV
tara:strand:+ start:343 stop:615 length:273 start_codon:yes stop_codon:yes gene_type:complete